MRVVSLFTGAGGLDLGFSRAGARIVFANDIDEDSCNTYRRNFGDHIVCSDIKKINVEDIPDCDLIIGGYPCLGFTVANINRSTKDKRNYLYLEYLRMLEAKKPPFFLVENVPGMKSLANGELFSTMLEQFRNACPGYSVRITILNAADYGVPQLRRRLIILGTKNEEKKTLYFPKPTHSEKPLGLLERLLPRVTLRKAIENLPLEQTNEIPNHVSNTHKVKITGYLGGRVLNWDKPSPTITGRGSRTGGPVIHPHPSLRRRLTVRECARIQSFPDDFVFSGAVSSCYAQVGNAVAPLFAFRLAQAVMSGAGYSPKPFSSSEWNLPWSTEIPQT